MHIFVHICLILMRILTHMVHIKSNFDAYLSYLSVYLSYFVLICLISMHICPISMHICPISMHICLISMLICLISIHFCLISTLICLISMLICLFSKGTPPGPHCGPCPKPHCSDKPLHSQHLNHMGGSNPGTGLPLNRHHCTPVAWRTILGPAPGLADPPWRIC
jgi:hypothetical protein